MNLGFLYIRYLSYNENYLISYITFLYNLITFYWQIVHFCFRCLYMIKNELNEMRNTEAKNWNKTGELSYVLKRNGVDAGEVKFPESSLVRVATFETETEKYTLERRGLLKIALEINNGKGKPVLNAVQEKWYKNSYDVNFGARKLKMVIRNNPLAEFALLNNNEREINSYGLKVKDKKPFIEMKGEEEENNVLFDFLLWSLIKPAANESCGNAVVPTRVI